ncbi:MAG: sulfite exporter TauE/SafE family protein [Gammaproteobacteria bacterium]
MVELFGFSIALDTRLALMCLIVFVAGVIRGFLGFGSALLIVPALSVLYGPALAVVVGVLIEIPTSLGLLPVAIRQADRQTVTKMLLTFVVFVPVGTLLLKSVNPELMKVVISFVVLAMVGIIALQRRMVVLLSNFGTLFAGATSGIAQGMTGMAGPLFVTALLARGESTTQTRANIVALAAGLIAVSATSFILTGLVTYQAVFYTVLGTPVILLGVWAGSALFQRLSRRNLRGVILAFLALVAVATLAQTLL